MIIVIIPFFEILFVMLCKVVLILDSVDEILKRLF